MANIKSTIEKLIQSERRTARASLVFNALTKVKHNRKKGFDIEVVDFNKIEGGIEVFIKAWKGKKQVGFGLDGSVEIERFRIFNPPTLVDDPSGTILREWDDEDGVHHVRKLKEDGEEAILQTIEHNLSVMKNIHNDKNIVRGKVGNTTSTFYPDASVESTSVDGYAGYDPTATTWSALHDYTGTVTFANDSGTVLNAMVQVGGASSGYKQIVRSHIVFDTSALGDSDTISSAVLSLFGTSAGYQDGLSAGSINIYGSTVASATAVTTTDYHRVGSTAFSTSKDITTISQSAYEDFTLNASGIANISKTGVSKFSMREADYDGANSAPSLGNGEFCRWEPSSADVSGTTQDPKLVIEHTSSVSVTANAGVVSITASTPAPSVSGQANVAQGTPPSATFSTPAPAISGGANVSASVLTATFSLPVPNIITPDSYVDVGVLTATFSTPAPSVTGQANVEASVVTTTFSIPTPAVSIGFTHNASPLIATFSTPAPTIIEESNISVSASVVTATFSIPSVSIVTVTEVQVNALLATFSIPTPVITATQNVSVSASVVTATFSVNTPRKIGGLWTPQGRTEGVWTPQARIV